MGKESTQKKLSRVRPPRVQITYDVEVGDAMETKELPFVLGVLGDYAGHPSQPPEKLKDRKFVEIDRDNFNEVMQGIGPRLNLRVENRMAGDGTEVGMELKFKSLFDFEPARVVEQVDSLRELLDIRTRLADLKNKISGNDKLEELLDEIVRDTEKLKRLQGTKSEGEEK